MSSIHLLKFSQLWQFIPLLLTGFGFFLSLWIIVPAPTFSLLVFGVGVPELSPWVTGLNAIALMLILVRFQLNYFNALTLVITLIALALSLLPLIQFSAANTRFQSEIENVLGKDYLQQIPPTLRAKMRPQPLVLADVFRGVTLQEVRIERDLQFANPDGQELKLNVYRPLSSGKYPGLIVIYGGAWRQGNPSDYEYFSRYIAAQGYSVIAIDYRHAPQYQFPSQLEDVQTALNFISDRADELEIDLQRVAIIGRSAGAQLASIVAYQNQSQIKFQAIINYYGPVNLVYGYRNPPSPDPIDTRQVLEDFLGGTPETKLKLYQQASPIKYLKPNLLPSLLIYAQRDHLVEAKYGKLLYERLQITNNCAALLTIPWAEHAFDVVFSGVSNQLALYYTERFLAWSLYRNQLANN
ncbi:alpha/beta hydrolase [Pleurocapsa sp. PCC 7319]|uniref:alpha/beta hydrolase n=1 Tax=Pleurocapsa sp. PCC 7319 TaxID=118161 RepID=UPI00034A3226|nr:alpha/beta hydrolase [Pleurocapsa sp. PCC 7319]